MLVSSAKVVLTLQYSSQYARSGCSDTFFISFRMQPEGDECEKSCSFCEDLQNVVFFTRQITLPVSPRTKNTTPKASWSTASTLPLCTMLALGSSFR